MIFYEKLGLAHLLSLLLTKKRVFYGGQSIATRLFEKLNIKINATRISFGDVQTSTDIRKNAYLTAELYLDNIKGKQWADELSGALAIDFSLIAKKVFFNGVYFKYEFIGLALKYAQEHPNESHVIYVDEQFLGSYKDKLKENFKLKILRNYERINFLSIFTLPIFLWYFWKKSAATCSLFFNNKIICKVDGEGLYEMFSTIFQALPAKEFVIEKEYATAFSKERLAELQIKVLGLNKNDYLYLRHAVYQYIFCCVKHYGKISSYRGKLFDIFYVLIRGKSIAIEGTGNLFFTHEHMVPASAARNEFLRSDGNRSIFLPLHSYATNRYYYDEIFINLDVMCAVGKHHIDIYKARRAITSVFLPTGSYNSHRGYVNIQSRAERIARLKAFKGDSVAVTILSPGICDPTYSHEVRLMKLARDISMQQGIKVFIRTKPMPPAAKYASFYDTYTAGCDSILLTFSEYELTDFLDVTDLFVTSISGSACDLAMCGGQVMFIDYLKDTDLFLYWTAIKEVVLTEEESFQTIMDWVRDGECGQIREDYRKNMQKLSDYLGYQFPDFDSYKANLLAQLRSTFKNHPALVEIERDSKNHAPD